MTYAPGQKKSTVLYLYLSVYSLPAYSFLILPYVLFIYLKILFVRACAPAGRGGAEREGKADFLLSREPYDGVDPRTPGS